MALTKYRLGELISLCTGGNEESKYDESQVKGISVNKEFISTKADLTDVSLTNYTVVHPKCFSFVTVTSRNGNKISIAYNNSNESFLVSSFYVTFKLNDFGKTVLLEDYLFMFFNRTEFDRYVRRDSWGSAREYFYFENICDVLISLPDISIQQKYVDIYKAMVANQQSYERGLEDLKLVCDGYIEDLRRKIPCEKIGQHIREINNRNSDLRISNVQGVNSTSRFDETKANTTDLDFTNYKIVTKNQFAYNPSRINLGSIALRDEDDCIISPMYVVFEVSNTQVLLPEYLMLWLSRKEFQRSTLFYAIGSVRDTFGFDLMKNVSIPIPDINVQKAIVNIYSVYIERKQINEQLKSQIKNICPILIKGSLEEK